MTDLKSLYDKLPLPKKQNSNSYTAKSITGYENHRIAKNYTDNPSLLIYISEQNQDFYISNQNLFNIKISHNVKCEIESEKNISHNNFSVVSYIGQSNDVKDVFLSTCQVLIKSLGKNPSNKKIKNAVGKFIELFRAIKETPKKSIQGLWAELFLIEQSIFPENLIAGWHSIPEEYFDFSFGNLRLEVKSSATESRVHHFSSNQLNPINDTTIVIASIQVNVNSSGKSLFDLINSINNRLFNFPMLTEKLHFLVYTILGADIEIANQVKYDYDFAQNSLRFYNSFDIPKIEIANIPKEVSNVKFVSNLINSKYTTNNIDTLIAPYIKQ